MSKENVEMARQAIEAIQRRDRTTYLALHDDDFNVVPFERTGLLVQLGALPPPGG